MTSLVWFVLVMATIEAPSDWSCDVERWGDGLCDCDCTASDDLDCTSPCPAGDDDDDGDNDKGSDDDDSGSACAHTAPTWAGTLALGLLLRRRRPR